MKKHLNKIIWALLPLFSLVACSPDDPATVDGNGLPKISDVNVTVSIQAEVATFHIDKTDVVPIWDITVDGETTRYTSNDLQVPFALPGTYSVEVKVYNKNGISDGSITKEFSITNTPTLSYLTNGSSKTWMWDYTVNGHFGCGPAGSTGLSWWSCGAYGKAGSGMYDDEMTFNSSMEYNFYPGADGKVHVNKDSKYKTEYYANDGNDYDAPCDELTTTYKMYKSGSNLYIEFPENTMVSYIPNPEALTTPKYKILTLNDTLLDMCIENSWIAWHYRFVPKESKKK